MRTLRELARLLGFERTLRELARLLGFERALHRCRRDGHAWTLYSDPIRCARCGALRTSWRTGREMRR